MPPRGSKAEAAPASVWDLLATSNRPDAGKADERKALLKYWGEGPLNFILGEDLDEREVVPGSGIYSRKLIWTSDEKDDQAPLKPFPEWEYIQRYITVLHEEREVVSDKARQMFMTTATLLYILWNCLFKFNRRWIWTKTTEDESIAHLQSKVRAVHARLPQWVKEALPISEAPQDTVLCLKTNSVIIAGAENVAIRAARGGTATGFGLDEGAFMDQFQVAWAAAAPMCGKIFALTTPNIGTRGATAYYALLERDSQRYVGDQDHSGKPVATSDLPTIQGFGVRRNSSGYAIVEVDLEADPDKRSPAFIEELHRRQPNQREFEREYRRNWTIAAGESFYPEFVNNGAEKAYVQPLAHLIAGPIFRCWDFGFRRPACLWFQIDPETERVWVIRELLCTNINTWAFADLVLHLSGELGLHELPEDTEQDVYKWVDRITADSRLPDPPWFEWEGMPPRFVDLCGPEVSKVNSHYEKDSKENTDAEILEGRGISVSITSAQWQARENVMRKLLRMKEDGYPGLLVDPACRLLIEALGGALCYALPSAANPMPDAPAKNGTHDNIHDALSYGLVQVVGLDEFAMKDGRYKGKGRLPPPPPQALFHEAQHTSAAFTHATRPRLGRAYR